MKKRCISNARDNRGSGLITVVVTMSFVAMLGVVLMFLVFMNAQIKNADRYTRRNFYNAENALDQVRAELQGTVSDSIETAYTAALTSYENSETVFVATFIRELEDALDVFTATYSCSYRAVMDGGTVKYFTVENVVLNYVENGYENTIYTDFEIQIPPFEAQSYGRYTRLSDFVIIADDALVNNSISATAIKGNIYVGSLDVSGNLRAFSIDAARFTCGGDIIVSDGGMLRFENDTEIWANRIKVGTNGVFAANSSRGIFVADDLELSGDRPYVQLVGSYYGYGNSTTDSSKSSAIIINGSGATLGLSTLTTLQLAGRSFITDGNSASADIPMSGSFSVRSDQLAYLVPDRYISINQGGVVSRLSNPTLVGTENEADITVNLGTLATRYGASYTMRYYPLVGGGTLRYFFLTFDTEAHRDAYFKDYYDENNKLLQEYLDLSLIDNEGSAGTSVTTDGYFYDYASAIGYTLRRGVNVPATNYAEQYGNLKTTLRKQGDTDALPDATPFTHYVRTDKIAADFAAGSVIPFTYEGKTVAVIVTGGNFTLDATLPDVNIVISAGDNATVTVARPFTGLILAHGTVTTSPTLSGTADGLNAMTDGRSGTTLEAFSAVNGDGTQLMEYMQGATKGSTVSVGGKSWNLNELVTYRNWSKNEER